MVEELKKDFGYYKGFKLKHITQPKYRHLLMILFWPFYLITFFTIEHLALKDYHVIHCALDDIIPFNEYFIIPYVIWYPFWICMLFYTVFFEVETFKKTMRYFILTFSISLCIYALWHTGHNMWPTSFPRDNFCIWLVKRIYAADCNTNICPSDHVIGAFAVVFAAKDVTYPKGLGMDIETLKKFYQSQHNAGVDPDVIYDYIRSIRVHDPLKKLSVRHHSGHE